tara:strand:+ start:3272 stop:3442 length:171 start_codon:yes stop_codon:yes gene_type:complete
MRFERDPEEQKAIDEWLKNNEVTICPPGARSEPGEVGYTWGKKPKKKATKKKAKKG